MPQRENTRLILHCDLKYFHVVFKHLRPSAWGYANKDQIEARILNHYTFTSCEFQRQIWMVDVNGGAAFVEKKHLHTPKSLNSLRLERDKGAFIQEPDIKLMRLFSFHASIEHFRVERNNKPLLLFADMEEKEYSSARSYQNAKAVLTTRQNVTMGLKKEILFFCTFNTMVSFSKLSCRCQGQCLVAKVA